MNRFEQANIDIDHALSAIGRFDPKTCRCDPDVGVICEECAIRTGLDSAKRAMYASRDLLEALRSFGVLSCTPEWMAKRDAAIAKALGQ